jgi:hypothetical protein
MNSEKTAFVRHDLPYLPSVVSVNIPGGETVEALQQDQYIVIELGTEKYALKISEVYEIINSTFAA